MQGWQPIGGRWSEHEGVFSNATYGRGDMLIAQHSEGSNYTVSADIRFDLLFPETHYGDAGLVIRTTNPEQGVDSYQGYYAGIRPDQQTLVLGRASYDWHQLKTSALASPVWVGEWYHLALSAQGCQLTVTVTPQNGRTCVATSISGCPMPDHWRRGIAIVLCAGVVAQCEDHGRLILRLLSIRAG